MNECHYAHIAEIGGDASGRASLLQKYHFIAEVVYLRANYLSIMHLWKVMIDIKWSTREGRRPHPRPTEILNTASSN